MLILKTLNDEFDVDKFVLEKLIISHFPLEDTAKCEKIT
jgi:anoctamin-10